MLETPLLCRMLFYQNLVNRLKYDDDDDDGVVMMVMMMTMMMMIMMMPDFIPISMTQIDD